MRELDELRKALRELADSIISEAKEESKSSDDSTAGFYPGMSVEDAIEKVVEWFS